MPSIAAAAIPKIAGTALVGGLLNSAGAFDRSAPEVTSTPTPFERNYIYDLLDTKKTGRDSTRDSTSSGTNVINEDRLTEYDAEKIGLSGGLEEDALLDPLRQFAGGVDLTPRNELAGLITQRMSETTPQGYLSARRKAIEDLNSHINRTGVLGAARGRSGDYFDREQRIGQEAANRALLDAYDEGTIARDQHIADLSARSNDLDFDRALQYAELLNTSPFARRSQENEDRTTQEDFDTSEITNEVIKELFGENILETLAKTGTKSEKGFNTNVNVQAGQPSAVNQLLGLGLGIGGLPTAGGGSLGGDLLGGWLSGG